jgi:3-hydroxypropanoate dehydrogenase
VTARFDKAEAYAEAKHQTRGAAQGIGGSVDMMATIEKMGLSDDALDVVFRNARTYNAWLPKPVPEDLLRQLYDTLKWGPTSANMSPARFVFIRSPAAKERLRSSLAPGNIEKTMAAPVTVIVAYDLKFYDKLPKLFPHYPAMRDLFVNNPQLIQETALRNSTLQGAYMIIAARALGLDCGPMSGFDNAKLDEEFFAAGNFDSGEEEFFPEGHVKSNFLCNIGYGDPAKLFPRGPRLGFGEACTLL